MLRPASLGVYYGRWSSVRRQRSSSLLHSRGQQTACCCCCCTPYESSRGATAAALHPRHPRLHLSLIWRPGRGPGHNACFATPPLFSQPCCCFFRWLIDVFTAGLCSICVPLPEPLLRFLVDWNFVLLNHARNAPPTRMGDADFRFGPCRKYIRDYYCSIKLQSAECFYLKFMGSNIRSEGIFSFFYWESRI